MIRRTAFDAAGGWPGHFCLFHEGIDLAWKLRDQGGTGRYLPDIVVHHPATNPARHDRFYRLNARNRVWLARRNLPAPLIPSTLPRSCCSASGGSATRPLCALSSPASGEGMCESQGRRTPMSRRTVARLTRAGRPPIV
ncbi:hypothetical protein GCM10017562_02060 [Streptomyces roseofulvus]